MKMQLLLTIATVVIFSPSVLYSQGKGKAKKYRTIGKIERFDPRLDKLVPKGAKIEVIVSGHVWTEGPCWVPNGRYLLFSDIPRNAVYKWKEGEGESLFLKPSGYTGKEKRENETGKDEPGSNGLLLDPQGRLILMQHGDRRVARLEKDGTFTTLASHYKGKRLNSPNDGVFDSKGNLYFTDPPYGLKKRWSDPARELDFCGVYRLSKLNSKKPKLTLLTKEMSRPNGIGLSPDERTLYVANSDPLKAVWMAFPIRKNGRLGKGKVFYDATKWVGRSDRKGLPDGMCIDAQGNLFATGPGGVYVFTPRGELLGLINTGERTSNCTFGDDGSTLYMTTDDYVTRIRLTTKGRGF